MSYASQQQVDRTKRNDNRPQVLFVDDDQALLNGLRRSLRKHLARWDMRFVESGKQALKHLELLPCQVLVADIMMPGMDGIELIRAVNQTNPRTQCIVLSSSSEIRHATTLINSTRIFRFLSKPCGPDTLSDTLELALRQSSDARLIPSAARLAELFELTPSEARLTQGLLAGKSLNEAALEQGITASSARTYLRSIFAKTQTNRQGELVSRILLQTCFETH